MKKKFDKFEPGPALRTKKIEQLEITSLDQCDG